MIETFGQCLQAFLQEYELTAVALTARLRLKSKTTLLRLLHDECTTRQCAQMLERLRGEGMVDAEWRERFNNGIIVLARGVEVSRFYSGLQVAFGSAAGRRKAYGESHWLQPLEVEGPEEILILGCEGWALFRAIRDTLYQYERCVIRHVVSREELMRNETLLPGLISLISRQRYEALLVEEANVQAAQLPWNQVLVRGKRDALGLWNGEKYAFSPLEKAERPALSVAMDALKRSQAVPLFRNGNMSKGLDYIQILEECYQMERAQHSCIVKSTPCLQMIPTKYICDAFYDLGARNFATIVPAGDSMQYLLAKRFENFCTKKQSTTLLLAEQSMRDFAINGYLDDHFVACRAFNAAERRGILMHLSKLMEQPNFRLAFIDDEVMAHCSFEAHRNEGTLIFPTRTNYSVGEGGYREMFLPGSAFARRFMDYTEDVLLSQCDFSIQRTREMLNELLAIVGEDA